MQPANRAVRCLIVAGRQLNSTAWCAEPDGKRLRTRVRWLAKPASLGRMLTTAILLPGGIARNGQGLRYLDLKPHLLEG